MNYKRFTHKDCEFYPCHKEVEELNCLFCYCPLYSLGDECGGKYIILDNGIKDCSLCILPHTEHGYDYITNKLIENLPKGIK